LLIWFCTIYIAENCCYICVIFLFLTILLSEPEPHRVTAAAPTKWCGSLLLRLRLRKTEKKRIQTKVNFSYKVWVQQTWAIHIVQQLCIVITLGKSRWNVAGNASQNFSNQLNMEDIKYNSYITHPILSFCTQTLFKFRFCAVIFLHCSFPVEMFQADFFLKKTPS
jgi:hypothetical protein